MFANLKINEIAPDPEQPRKFFDEVKHEELKNSIKENGLLQAVVVRPDEGGETPYKLIAGERRWRACKAAGLEVIPAKVLKDADDERAYVLGIAENVGREDMTIMEEATAYLKLKLAGWDEAKIAKQFGKTETHIKWRIGLLTLRPEVGEMVNKGQIKNNLAWHIAQLNPANQMVVAMKYVRGEFDSEAEAQHFANAMKMREDQTSLTNEKAPSVEEEEKRKKQKAKAKDGLGKAEEVLLPLLEELAAKKPEDLAVILGDDLTRHVKVVGRLYSKVQMVRNILSKAQGHQRVMAEEFNKAAVEVQQEQAEAKGKREVEAEAKSEPQSKPPAKPESAVKPVAKKAAAKPGPKPAATPRARTRTAAKPAPKSPAPKAPAQRAEPKAEDAKTAEAAEAK